MRDLALLILLLKALVAIAELLEYLTRKAPRWPWL